jgi:hypothetical protein
VSTSREDFFNLLSRREDGIVLWISGGVKVVVVDRDR